MSAFNEIKDMLANEVEVTVTQQAQTLVVKPVDPEDLDGAYIIDDGKTLSVVLTVEGVGTKMKHNLSAQEAYDFLDNYEA